MEGWLLLHRKMQDNGLWQDKPFAKGQAWIDLLMSASHKDHSFWVRDIEVKVKAGQVAMSEVTMSKRWGWSRNKVRRFLSYLENNGKTIQQKSNVTTLITILNWKSYQETKQQTKQQKGSNETPNDTQSKNVKNEKKKTYGLADNVLLTEKEYQTLTDKLGNVQRDEYINRMSTYDRVDTYKSHHKAILKWWNKDGAKVITQNLTGCESPELDEAYARANS